jgi:radical SAM superfamily enzyme YgiQ (UPF0313 family)
MKTYPLNLLYLATYLREVGGHEATIIDGENIEIPELRYAGAEDMDPGDIMNKGIPKMVRVLDDPKHQIWKKIGDLIRGESPDIVGITCNSGNMDTAAMITAKVRELGTPVILGGSHPTVVPQESLEYTGADYALCGEGEMALRTLMDTMESGGAADRVPSVAWRKGSSVVINPRGPLINPVDQLPIPDRSLIDRSNYFGEVIITGRGCPYDCVYCASRNIWGRRVRLRGVDSVINELEAIRRDIEKDESGSHIESERPGAWVMKIVDDTFTVNRKRTLALLDQIIHRGLNCFEFTGGVRVDTLDEEVAEKLRQANVKRVTIGVETGSPRMLEMIKKGVTNEQVIRGINLLKSAGVGSHAFFMIGLPGEKPEDIELSKELILEARPDRIEVNMVTPYPGTALWKSLMDLEPKDVDRWRRWFHQGMATHSNRLGFDLDKAYEDFAEFARKYHGGEL